MTVLTKELLSQKGRVEYEGYRIKLERNQARKKSERVSRPIICNDRADQPISKVIWKLLFELNLIIDKGKNFLSMRFSSIAC